MKNNKPKISVIIRTYNSGKFVKKAIDSALRQTLNKELYEILVIDDGSEDNTLDILKNYKGKIRLIHQEHLGGTPATNRGILESRGKYVTLLDSDDQFLPYTLEKMLKEFEKDKFADFVYCDYFEKPFYGVKRKKVSLKKNIFNSLATAIMFKKELFKELGLNNKDFVFAEYDFLLRMMKAKKIGKHLPIPLYVYIRTEGSLTFDEKVVEKGISQLRKKYGKITEKIRKY